MNDLNRRSTQTLAARAFWSSWGFLAIGCSLASANPLNHSGPPRGLNSFVGVRFGASREEVERRYPTGFAETSPYGAPAYKVENVESGNFQYRDVVYEFTDTSGMQLAIAHFAPSASADVYQLLQTTLGTPSSAGATQGGSSSLEATWQMADGSTVLFSGPAHRVVLLGKSGASLKVDIQLRDEDTPLESRQEVIRKIV